MSLASDVPLDDGLDPQDVARRLLAEAAADAHAAKLTEIDAQVARGELVIRTATTEELERRAPHSWRPDIVALEKQWDGIAARDAALEANAQTPEQPEAVAEDGFEGDQLKAGWIVVAKLEAEARDPRKPLPLRVRVSAQARQWRHNLIEARAVGVEDETPEQDAAFNRLGRQLQQRAIRPRQVRATIIVRTPRIRRGHCGPRRRPRARRVASRSTGGGSSGDPDAGEPAGEHHRGRPGHHRHLHVVHDLPGAVIV